MSVVAKLKEWQPRYSKGEVTCAWCHRTAIGWAQLPGDDKLWYPSCGMYPDTGSHLHGRNFTVKTNRECLACGDLIEPSKRRDAVYCSQYCKRYTLMHPIKIRIATENDLQVLERAERKAGIARRASRAYRVRGSVASRMGYQGGELGADISAVS